ncbi:MAG: FkbM family methyltransferase [Pseudomonadota bacterium]|nr:FkbM family methyltransferase [Pseudomonadota bacterium]
MHSPGTLWRKLRDGLLYRAVSGRRGRRVLFRHLRDAGVGVTREAGGIRLIAHADKIGMTLARGELWQRAEFNAAVALLGAKGKLAPGGVFVDVGANIGMHSVYAAKSGQFARVVAIEPLEANFRLIEANAALNGVGNITAVRCAAGARDGEVKLFTNAANAGKSSIANDMGGGHETVRVRPLEAILADSSVDASDVRVLWIDVEGYEPDVLAGMPAMLARRVPTVMEFSPIYLKERQEPLADLLEANYNACFVIEGSATREVAFADLRSVRRQFDIVVF